MNRGAIALVVATLFAAGCGGGAGAVSPVAHPLGRSVQFQRLTHRRRRWWIHLPWDPPVPAQPRVGPRPTTLPKTNPATSDDSGEIDDGADSPMSPGQGQLFKHPFEGLSQQKLESQYAQKPESLGSISVGYTNGGALVNGVQMPAGDGWELVDANHAWGARKTNRLRGAQPAQSERTASGRAPHVHWPRERAARGSPLASRQVPGGTRRRHQLLLSPRRSALVRDCAGQNPRSRADLGLRQDANHGHRHRAHPDRSRGAAHGAPLRRAAR